MSGKCNLLLSILYYLLPYLVWKTVPTQAGFRISCDHRFATTTSVQKESRIARMRRICSFTDVLFDALGLCAPDGRKDFDGFSSTGGIPRR